MTRAWEPAEAKDRTLRTVHVVDLEAELQRARQDSVELSSQMKVQIAENVEKVNQFTEFEVKVLNQKRLRRHYWEK